MGMLTWVMMGLAIWHFTVFLPDRFWAGIIGAFVGAVIGSVLFALAGVAWGLQSLRTRRAQRAAAPPGAAERL